MDKTFVVSTARRLALLSFLACGPGALANSFIYQATLDGASELPSNNSTGIGSATVTYNDQAHTLAIDLTFSGLVGATTSSHIHSATASFGLGSAGVATVVPSLPNFPLGVTSGSYDFTLDLTSGSSFNPAFVSANGGTAAGAEIALVDGLAAGEAYIDIASTDFPGGEIRGFLFATALPDSTNPAILIGAAVLGMICLSSGRRGFGHR